MKVLYLASGTAQIKIPNIKVYYNDFNIQRDIQGDMLKVDLNGYDLIIATPPCNYYSKPNWKRNTSSYSLSTKHLLPAIIKKLEYSEVPVIIENVINKPLMRDIINNTKLFYYEYGRHCYFTNRLFTFTGIPQERKSIYKYGYTRFGGGRQGGNDVNIVFEYYIKENL